MGILNKLFKFKSQSEPPMRTVIHRESRVELLPLHNVSFKLIDPPVGNPLPIANLSFGGLGLLNTSGKNFSSTSKLKGVLIFSNREIPVELLVAHCNEQRIGCSFSQSTTELKRSIQTYFDLELKALDMKKVDDHELRSDSTGTPHWHLGENNCELYFVESKGELTLFRVSFFGNLIEYSRGMPLKYGFEIGDPEKSGIEVIPGALKFVKNIAAVDEKVRTEILDLIQKNA